MKNFRRTMRHFIPSIIFSVIFTLLFPYSIAAQQTEYKVPEHSMSYLVMAQADAASQTSTQAVKQDTNLTASDRKDLEPEFESQTVESARIQIVPEPAEPGVKIQPKASPAKKAAVRVAASPKSAIIAKPAIKESPVTSDERTLDADSTTRYDTPCFSDALSRMQQNKAHREAEAARLGIVLPSQGGDMAAVSPSLSKIQQTLKTIMTR
ncbi:MAG: hypothetical protein CVV41_00580 [Candidatus Riflebacteria bacterium HGW-Riflebacteria-1]|nr:MAG: hypothetical protein CVV41_00580 [Candidatus Riflebacteria bacterium HGW-Riflebacteria-1]